MNRLLITIGMFVAGLAGFILAKIIDPEDNVTEPSDVIKGIAKDVKDIKTLSENTNVLTKENNEADMELMTTLDKIVEQNAGVSEPEPEASKETSTD